jgi:gamma-glutamyltranspeptidase / glutathione hydrolase
MKFLSCSVALAVAATPLFAQPKFSAQNAVAERGMVASVDPIATETGVRIMKEGGNAVDAAVAVGLMLGVVNGYNSGIGGGCFMLIRTAKGKFIVLDGREMAPAAASRDMFVRNGEANGKLSATGALASGVPGALAAYEYAAKHFGKKNFKELILPAAKVAEEGFEVGESYARRLKATSDDLAKFPATKAVFFKSDSGTFQKGDELKQPDLAKTYREIAKRGSKWFYRGEFAKATEQWMKANGGLMTARDFANYKLEIRQPITTTYRGYRLVTVPPPSSGGLQVVETMNLLENINLQKYRDDRGTFLHIVGEALKLTFADRAFWAGDPAFVKVPRGLMDKKYAAELAKRIDLEKDIHVPTHGMPPNAAEDFFGKKHTTHFSVADSQGNWVACTATVNTSFGSKVVIPGTGVVMNNEMDDFAIQPGVSNLFGLIGGEANAVAPGKRPISNMSPTIVLKNDKPIMALGAAGGPKIVSQVIFHLVNMLDLGMSPAETLNLPRVHHQWFPNVLRVEESLPDQIKKSLATRGHELGELGSGEVGVSQIVARGPNGKGFLGAADPRVRGKAAGF